MPYKEELEKNVIKGRRKCSFRNSKNRALIDVYPDVVEIDIDPGFEFNPVRLSLGDLRHIRECILK